ncbi:52 kda repressor of the inhibitor of the protein kinase [Plakobranchus ocellatus]|uniref:52 kDa repressor of the inhibitor of the protein kinase n=1 Tax=Plakobranchus ocellatus TaxID=259542 RepID=A0AAV4B0L4_9GAST|nr:52 kda repressor of the inhibitor of the protein kinase [Plakobranchus ocellatus]
MPSTKTKKKPRLETSPLIATSRQVMSQVSEARCRRWVINSRRADLDRKSAEALSKGNVLCSEHFESHLLRRANSKNFLRRNSVPTTFHIPNPPPQLTPSRPAPKVRISETFSPDITLPQSSDPPAEPGSDQPAEPGPSNLELISSHENQVKTLKRKLNSEKFRNFHLTKKLKTSKSTRDNTSESEQATAEKEQVEKLLQNI